MKKMKESVCAHFVCSNHVETNLGPIAFNSIALETLLNVVYLFVRNLESVLHG